MKSPLSDSFLPKRSPSWCQLQQEHALPRPSLSCKEGVDLLRWLHLLYLASSVPQIRRRAHGMRNEL